MSRRVADTKLYDLLELKPDATPVDVKKAYRKLAMRWHPDKNPTNKEEAEEKFKAVTEAYEILSDENKRQVYDRHGLDAVKNNGGGGSARSARDLFEHLFGGGIFGGGGFGGDRGPRRSPDIQFQLGVTLEDLYKGRTKKLKVSHNVICEVCNGKGSEKENAVQSCGSCRGSGREMLTQRVGPGMIQQMMIQCRTCGGKGEMVNEKDRCKGCKGKKVVPESKILEVHIEKGMMPGQKIRFYGDADQEPGLEPGDIIVILVPKDEPEEEKDSDGDETMGIGRSPKSAKSSKGGKGLRRPKFMRLKNGTDLVMERELSLLEALLGFEFAFKHLDDRVIVVKSPPGHVIGADDVMIVEGEGMPVLRSPFQKGDLYIKLSIAMPKAEELKNPKVQAALRAVLPPPAPLPAEAATGEVHVAKKYDSDTARSRQRENAEKQQDGLRDHDRDDDDDERGGGGPQCRQM